jgi:DNA-binding winged helix-turn-helix (wHTH) protein
MIPKSGYRFSEKIMLNSMIPKSGYRFSEKIMLKKQAKVKW